MQMKCSPPPSPPLIALTVYYFDWYALWLFVLQEREVIDVLWTFVNPFHTDSANLDLIWIGW